MVNDVRITNQCHSDDSLAVAGHAPTTPNRVAIFAAPTQTREHSGWRCDWCSRRARDDSCYVKPVWTTTHSEWQGRALARRLLPSQHLPALRRSVDQPPGPPLIPHTRRHVMPPPAPANDLSAAVDDHVPASSAEEGYVDDEHIPDMCK